MKRVVSAFVVAAIPVAALAGFAVGARADEPPPQGYTDADLNGGYA